MRARINPALELVCKPLPADDPTQRQPLIDLAQRHLGWQPTISLEQGLEPTIAWFQEVLSADAPHPHHLLYWRRLCGRPHHGGDRRSLPPDPGKGR